MLKFNLYSTKYKPNMRNLVPPCLIVLSVGLLIQLICNRFPALLCMIEWACCLWILMHLHGFEWASYTRCVGWSFAWMKSQKRGHCLASGCWGVSSHIQLVHGLFRIEGRRDKASAWVFCWPLRCLMWNVWALKLMTHRVCCCSVTSSWFGTLL